MCEQTQQITIFRIEIDSLNFQCQLHAINFQSIIKHVTRQNRE